MVKKCFHYTSCLNLSSVGKRLKKSMQQVLALRQNRFFLNICDYFTICQNTYLEIGDSGVLLRILVYFEARRCSRQTGSVYATHQPFEYNDPKDITQRSWYIYNNEFKRIK